MPIYQFECRECGGRFEKILHISEYHEPPCSCGGETDQVYDQGSGGFKLGQTPGERSGFYDYDYGKKATWDLTPPGKLDELKKAGVIRDPFDGVPPKRNYDIDI